MQISIINDCFDEDAKLRQISRVGALFPDAGVNCFAARSELEAAGLLVDALDAFDGREGIILANVAPRNGQAKKWKNGTPFGYFRYRNTLVVSSVDGLVLSLCKKLEIIEEFNLLDIETVMNFISNEDLDPKAKELIINTQFRSFNFLPRAAYWIWKGYGLPADKYDLADIAEAPGAVWFIDNFGNAKTTLVRKDFLLQAGERKTIAIGGGKIEAGFYDRLKDLPDGATGLIEGSSGIGDCRLLEVVIQGGEAAREFGMEVGNSVSIDI